MKKITLILALGTLIGSHSVPVKADVDTIRLAQALVATGVVTIAAGQATKWAYEGGYFKSIAKFCKNNPWYPVGGALISTGAVLLFRDAVENFLSPIGDLGREIRGYPRRTL